PAGPCPRCAKRLLAVSPRRRPTLPDLAPMREAAGEHATCEVWVNKLGVQRAKITCAICVHPERWVSRSDGNSRGQGSTVMFALDVWGKHLRKAHGLDCP